MRQKIRFPFIVVLAFTGLNAWTQQFQSSCPLPFDSIKVQHEIDQTCPNEGPSNSTAAKKAEARAKNNFCATGNAPIRLAFDSFERLQEASDGLNVHPSQLTDRSVLKNLVTVRQAQVGEGSLVQYVAYLLDAHASNVQRGHNPKFGEAVNCKRPTAEENDVHIVLGQDPQEDPCESITAEMSPHFRPDSWTPENLTAVRDHPVRITGQLFFDSSHHPCTDTSRASPPRAAVWEIHPVYQLEVCR